MKKTLLLLLCVPLLSQDTSQQTPVFRDRVSIVVAPTTVQRADGTFVNDLESKDFKLLDNGKVQQIQQDIAFVPVSMVVAIQRSAQTEQLLPSLKKIGTMLESLVLGADGEAAIVTFDHRIEKVCDFTNDGTKLNEALQNLRPGSTQAVMNDAVIESVRLLKTRPSNRRRVLLLVSETLDRSSGGRVKEALTDIQLANVIVYPVNMSRWLNKISTRPQPPRPSPIPVSAMPTINGQPQTPNTAMQMGYGGTYGSIIPVVREIFTATKAIFVDNPQELFSKYTGTSENDFVGLKGLEDAMQKIGEELQSQYLLSYNPNNKEDGGYHTIQVVVNRPNLKVRTRAGYWMAPN